MTKPVRVLVIDDSASMRAAIQRILSADPDIEVIGGAPEPFAARAMIKALNPDVLTLDIEMPGMDGLSFLEKIMRLRPMPVVMCSTRTARGTRATIEALRLGAVDCIAKPSGNAADLERDAALLRSTVKSAARSCAHIRPAPIAPMSAGAAQPDRGTIIAIGASTGGVEALFSLLAALPPDCPPVLIVQHMPRGYTAGFADHLDRATRLKVVEASHGMTVEAGHVYVAPGGDRHMALADDEIPTIRLEAAEPVNGHRPSVDRLFHSIVPFGTRAIGVILTGMGSDGAAGLLAMRAAGARTLGQNKASCVVYGMPRAAFAAGAVEREYPLSALPGAILAACRGHARAGA